MFFLVCIRIGGWLGLRPLKQVAPSIFLLLQWFLFSLEIVALKVEAFSLRFLDGASNFFGP
jgi:hypothetical protein